MVLQNCSFREIYSILFSTEILSFHSLYPAVVKLRYCDCEEKWQLLEQGRNIYLAIGSG